MSLSIKDIRKLCDKEMESDPEILTYINKIYRERIQKISEYCEIVCNTNTITEEDIINILEFIKKK